MSPDRPADAAEIERVLRRLELTVVRRLDGLLQGEHLGLLPGPGTEPAAARPYRPGEDDVRRMDWGVTARTTEPHARDLVADRELETWALVDLTASMDFGTARAEKRDLAVAAVAAVGFLAAGGGNRLGAHLLGPGGVRRLPARAGRPALLGLVRTLLTAPRGEPGAPGAPVTPLAEALDGLDRRQRRRGLRVVVSDFLDPEPGWEVPLRRLGARHQVLAVEVVDRRELELPDVGLLAVVDPETGRRREVWTGRRALRSRYAAAAAEHRATVRAALRRAGAAHVVLRTDRDWVRDLARFATDQRRHARARHHSRRAPGSPPDRATAARIDALCRDPRLSARQPTGGVLVAADATPVPATPRPGRPDARAGGARRPGRRPQPPTIERRAP